MPITLSLHELEEYNISFKVMTRDENDDDDIVNNNDKKYIHFFRLKLS